MCFMRHYRCNQENTGSMKVEVRGEFSRNFLRNESDNYVKACVAVRGKGSYKHVISC
jgi:hypothetical protein